MSKKETRRSRAKSEEEFHNGLVKMVASRIWHKYDRLKLHREYGLPTVGECDILGVRNGKYTYYEIKGHHSKKNRDHAEEQLQRFKNYYPDLDIQMVYAAMDKGKMRAERIR